MFYFIWVRIYLGFTYWVYQRNGETYLGVAEKCVYV